MTSKVLSYFGMQFDFFLIFICLLCIIMAIALFFLIYDYRKMRKRYLEFMQGESGKNLEYTIYKRFRDVDQLQDGQKDNDNQIAILYNKIRNSYSKTGIYKYNAFTRAQSDESEKTSFALTMLNEADSGFIINVIHSRAGSHIYLKEVIRGKSENVLSEEERESLNIALAMK